MYIVSKSDKEIFLCSPYNMCEGRCDGTGRWGHDEGFKILTSVTISPHYLVSSSWHKFVLYMCSTYDLHRIKWNVPFQW